MGNLRLACIAMVLVASVTGCDGDASDELLVDLKTDLVAGVEFTRVRAELFSEGVDAMEMSVSVGDSFIDGQRVADFAGVPRGTRTIRVTLFDAGGARVADRLVITEVDGATAVTVIVTRDCRAVSCPDDASDPSFSACVGGRCVDPRCSPETPEHCPTLCSGDGDCMADASCAVGRCDRGVCLAVPIEGECASTEACIPETGCVPAETPDAGSGIRLTVVVDGDGTGTVTSMPPGIDCPTFCDALFPAGTAVTLTASPDGLSALDGWSSAECTGSLPCTTTVTAPTTVTATISRRNAVFALVTGRAAGDLGGLAGADALCQDAATVAGIEGAHVAWLSVPPTNAIDRLAGARGWLRPDNQPFADTVDDIVAGRIYRPITLDAEGARLAPANMWVTTGTESDGTAAADTCNGFTTTTGLSQWPGSIYGTSGEFSKTRAIVDCSEPAVIYCFGTDYDRPVELTPSEGRIAFLASPWVPGGGIADADAHCQAEASAAMLPGTYRAYLHLTDTALVDRFDTAGAPWVRIDGVPVASTAEGFLTGEWDAPLNVTTDGEYRFNRVTSELFWYGRPGNSYPSASFCDDWMAGDGVSMGQTGNTASAYPQRAIGGESYRPVPCDTAQPIPCAQE